jgi:hypothetical protein
LTEINCWYYTLRDAASVVHAQVLTSHHGWAIRKAVAARMYAFLSKVPAVEEIE